MAVALDSYSDIEDDAIDSLTELFNKSAEHVKKLVPNLEPPKLLEIYSYYKQATEGSCNIPRPHWYEMQAKAKWDAWNSLGNISSDEAKKNYIKIISELDQQFDRPTDSKTENWVTVSCFANTDEILHEADKTVFDFVKEGNMSKLLSYMKKNPNSNVFTVKDDDGLGLIHWAADRGYLNVLKYLIRSKVNVNMVDKDGQTALHYATSCDHFDCVQFLIDSGADVNVKDTDGTLPVDLASDSKIVELLNNQV
ncbi:anorexia [Carabus blaptoides fortunei]